MAASARSETSLPSETPYKASVSEVAIWGKATKHIEKHRRCFAVQLHITIFADEVGCGHARTENTDDTGGCVAKLTFYEKS